VFAFSRKHRGAGEEESLMKSLAEHNSFPLATGLARLGVPRIDSSIGKFNQLKYGKKQFTLWPVRLSSKNVNCSSFDDNLAKASNGSLNVIDTLEEEKREEK
jgi:hypothetical protein